MTDNYRDMIPTHIVELFGNQTQKIQYKAKSEQYSVVVAYCTTGNLGFPNKFDQKAIKTTRSKSKAEAEEAKRKPDKAELSSALA